jgi:hypothetical protein
MNWKELIESQRSPRTFRPVEEIWREHGWRPPSTECPDTIEPLERGQWLEIIKSVKSSDRSEIAAAYEKVMPLVVEDWAHWLLSKPKTRRLPLIEQIAKHHGDSVGDMVKRKLTELHRDSFQKTSSRQSPTSR